MWALDLLIMHVMNIVGILSGVPHRNIKTNLCSYLLGVTVGDKGNMDGVSV